MNVPGDLLNLFTRLCALPRKEGKDLKANAPHPYAINVCIYIIHRSIMHGLGLSWGRHPCGSWGFRSAGRQRRYRTNAAASSAPSPSSQGLLNNPVLKAGLISGSMSLLGDVLAQLLTNGRSQAPSYDFARAARMGTFGLFFYGPYQHYWYRALESFFPLKSATHFLTKVTLNQLLLAPLVISVVFAWNLALQGKAGELPQKLRQDFLPSLFNGWKFWVPAASVNFWLVPVQHQVLYMSTCSVLWTAYLSFSSNLKAASKPATA